jgi:catechol 2,3-dioxygenase-like lactoylglutathione lyase family enzyme
MNCRSVFLEVLVRRFAGVERHYVSRLPDYPCLPPLFKASDLSNLPARDFVRRKVKSNRRKRKAFLRTAVATLFIISFPLFAAVQEVASIGLTVGDLKRELPFYTNTLPFEVVSIQDFPGRQEDRLLGLQNTKVRVVTLKLGDEVLLLNEHQVDKGRPIPSDSRSFDHWFQHVAIVVGDMDKAYDVLRTHKVKHVSTAPQTLPEWNKNAAGIKAFYFHDPEDHVLEIIWFPKGKGDPKWQENTGKLFLGIDHTAIVVSDTDTSLAFYRDQLGMRVVGESENYGIEQEHLNQVFGARLRITALRAERGPGIEFLEYLAPPGGRALSAASKPNDLVFWHTDLLVDHLDQFAPTVRRKGARLLSNVVELPSTPVGPARAVIVRDPDGHALELLEKSAESLTKDFSQSRPTR